MKYSEATKAYEYYLCGASLSKTGKRFGIDRRLLHYYFKAFGFKTRQLKRNQYIIYNGNSYTVNKEGYYRKTDSDRELLHRQMWKDINGEIKKGHNIHHINGNKTDNKIENLEMLTASDHTKRHGFKNNQHTKKNPEKYSYSKESFCHECDCENDI